MFSDNYNVVKKTIKILLIVITYNILSNNDDILYTDEMMSSSAIYHNGHGKLSFIRLYETQLVQSHNGTRGKLF